MTTLAPVIKVIETQCVNCHACIAACPVKYCNDGSGEVVRLDSNLCIGCGECLRVCTHGARVTCDDTERFLADLGEGVPMVAVVAPSVAVNFPGSYLRLNSWLKSVGISAVFDVSFGAELTIKSYLEHLKANRPALVIAQPCPVIVTYIEIYRPELLPYLAPADSPMLHTIRMIREYYPQYREHRVAVLSPCVAKRREFDETGLGDYNVTFAALQKHLDDLGIELEALSPLEYDNPPAERAVLFSTPGGLMRTALREAPEIQDRVRKIEGPHDVYRYLDELAETVERGKAPLVVDCLNCHLGCNGGTGTIRRDKSQDEMEWLVEQRSRAARARYEAERRRDLPSANGKKTASRFRWLPWPAKSTHEALTAVSQATPPSRDQLHQYIDRHWKSGLYGRRYVDLSGNMTVKTPSGTEVEAIYRAQLKKTGIEDELNCGACGYGSCKRMATALHNGLSREIHCALYKERCLREEEQLLRSLHDQQATESRVLAAKVEKLLTAVNAAAHGDLTAAVRMDGNEDIDRLSRGVDAMIAELGRIIAHVTASADEFQQAARVIAETAQSLASASLSQNASADDVRVAMSDLAQSVHSVSASAGKADETASLASRLADQGRVAVDSSIEAMRRIQDSSSRIAEIINVISDIADQTNLLALNAAIEAARAGQHGLGFAVVADEVRKLAERSNQAAREIAMLIRESAGRVEQGAALSDEAGKTLRMILEGVEETAAEIGGIATLSANEGQRAREVAEAINRITRVTQETAAQGEEMAVSSEQLTVRARELQELVARFKTREEAVC